MNDCDETQVLFRIIYCDKDDGIIFPVVPLARHFFGGRHKGVHIGRN